LVSAFLFSFIVWGLVARLYIWPALRNRQRADALQPILVLHSFRFVGLAFLIPGVVSPQLPMAFARPAAFGDLATAFAALIASLTINAKFGLVLVWVFNLLGSADLLYAFYQGNRTGLGFEPGLQGTAFFIVTVLVPVLIITHGLVCRLLLRKEIAAPSRVRPRAA
jgi:hypothetical protein